MSLWSNAPGAESYVAPLPALAAVERPRRLRVGLLLPVWYLGGVERYHTALAKWTSDAVEWVGCALTVGSLVKQTSIDALAKLMPIHADPYAGAEEARWNVIRHENEQQAIDAVTCRADILLTWGVQSLESRLKNFHGRVVVISHGDGQWTRAWIREAERRATDLVAVSTDAANAFSDVANVKILPGGVELDRLAPTISRRAIRDSWGVQNKIAVGYVGRFSEEKNPLRAAQVVAELGEKYVAIYHGHCPFRDEAFRAKAMKITDRIVWLDGSYHTGDVYHGLDCLVQASAAEGGPLVAMEAWMTDTPLVTTRVGIVKDDAEMRQLSWVVPADDLAQTAEAVSLAVDVMAFTRTPATERYSAAAMARRWELFFGESTVGPGSSLKATERLRGVLPRLMRSLGVKTLLDVPCGDFNWMRLVELPGVEYIGVDVSDLQIRQNRQRFPGVRFEQGDVTKSNLPHADAVFVRDLFVHLTFEQIRQAVRNIKATGAKWLIATTFPGRRNEDLLCPGWWRALDLTADPINFPEPADVFREGCTHDSQWDDKSIGLWELDAIEAQSGPSVAG